MQCTISKSIRAPVTAVFAAASDLPNVPSFVPAILKVEMLTNGPVGRGTRFRETRRVFGREHTEEMEVVEFDPPRSYTIGAESCGVRYRTEFRFVPEGAGTRVDMVFGGEPLTLFAKLMSWLAKPMMKKMAQECAKDLDALAAHVEKSATGR